MKLSKVIVGFIGLMLASSVMASGLMLTYEEVQPCLAKGEVFRHIATVRDSGVSFDVAMEKLKSDLPTQSLLGLAAGLRSVIAIPAFNPDMIYGFTIGECVAGLVHSTKSNTPPPKETSPEPPAKPKHSSKIYVS